MNHSAPLRGLPAMIFASRWLQLPLYLGLILAQAVYGRGVVPKSVERCRMTAPHS
jgi:uncharacterized membrane protein YqhA